MKSIPFINLYDQIGSIKADITAGAGDCLPGRFMFTIICLSFGLLVLPFPPAMAQSADDLVCLDVNKTTNYQAVSDRAIDFIMQKDSVSAGGKIRGKFRAFLTPGCQNLFFHNYVTYVPIYDQICVGKNILKTRTGHTCRIEALKVITK